MMLTLCFIALAAAALPAQKPDKLQQAVAALQVNDAQLAEKLAREALEAAPNDKKVAARNFLGMALGQQQRYTEAIEVFEENIRVEPGEPGGYANLAEALRRAGRPKEAIPLLEKAVSLKPDSLFYVMKLRLARIQVGEYEEIAAQTSVELKKSPPPTEWLTAAAAIALHRGKWEDAATILGEMKRTFQPEIYGDLILDPAFSAYSGRPELRALFPAKIEVQPAGPLTKKAMEAYADGRYDESFALAEQATTAGEPPSHIETMRGAIHFARQKYPEAAAAFAKAAAHAPQDASLQLNLGEALRASGRPTEAAAAFQAAVMLTPSNEIYALKLAFALIEAGQAAEVLDKGLAQVSGGPLLLAKAGAAARQGDLTQAATLLKAAQKTLPPDMVSAVLQDPVFQPYRDSAELKAYFTVPARTSPPH